MIYPRLVYKTRDNYRKVNNESEHRKMAGDGWKDSWLDSEPYKFVKENAAQEEIVYLEQAKKEIEEAHKKGIMERAKSLLEKKVSDGNSKRPNKKKSQTTKS